MIIQTTLSTTSGTMDPHGAAKAAASGSAGTSATTVAPTRQQIEAAVDGANRALPAESHSLQFSMDKSSDRVVVRIVDSATGETLRQIPTEQVLAIAESIDNYQKGLLLSQEA